MITVEYLRKILRGFAVSDGQEAARAVVEAPDIMEGLAQLSQRKEMPLAILFEEAYHYDDDDRDDVPCTRFEQSTYVKRIRALLLKRQHEGDPELAGWTRTARRDFVSGAANYVGWKLKVTFVEDESWEL